MPEDIDASASDAASSNFYSSPGKDEDPGILTKPNQNIESAEELEMPTEDDEEVSSGIIGSPSSDDPMSEPSAVYTSSVLPEGSPMSPTDPTHLADNKASHLAAAYLERKRKRGSNTGTNSTHSLVGAVRPEQHESNTSEFFLVHSGGKAPLEHEADESESSPKRTKVSQRRETEMEQGLSAALRDIATAPSSHKVPLPIEIWQHVFTFVPPVSLGRLLRVNHAFRACLMESLAKHSPSTSQREGVLNPEEADVIWSASRKLFCPGLPRPLRAFKELDMWRLIRGRNCQFCGMVDRTSAPPNSTNSWEAGPGKDGVRVIWAFGVRCCGPCLQDNSEKEMDLLFSSSTPSFLLPALPFVFVTPSLHVISSIALRNSKLPPDLEIKKHFCKRHIGVVKKEFEEVKAMGSATAEEWVKGLEQDGKDKLCDAARWEQWEAKGGLRKVNSRPAPKAITSHPLYIGATSTCSPVGNVLVNEIRSEHSTPVSTNNNTDGPGHAFSPAPTINATGTPMPSRGYPAPPPRFSVSPLHNGYQHNQQAGIHQPRIERNIRDVNEAKANRRAEIERRCMAFDPPLLPNVLNHMESFQAAIQISTPLTDSAWEVLKPRLLAQRGIAERREHDRFVQSQLFQVKFEERRQQEFQSKETKEALDREWDDIQAPIRDRVSLYADEIIREEWSGGQAVTKDTSPRFAADVLLYVRERFYADIAQENAAIRAAGQAVELDHPDRPPTRKLILENMKWVFDSKIKPLTEHFQKELFLCNGCDSNFKFYGFEGVIQHYAAKHTNTLSLGSVVVHWRAEWPDHPPFHPNPSAAKTAFYAIPTPAPGSIQAQPAIPPQALQPPNGFGGYAQPLEQGTQITQPPQGYPQFSPGPYGRPYPGQYHQTQHGPFAPPPPQGFQGFVPGFQGPNPSYQQGPPSRPGFHDPHIGYAGPSNGYEGYPGSYQGQVPQIYSSPFPGHTYLRPNHLPDHMMPQGYGPAQVPYGQAAGSAPGPPPHLPIGWARDGSSQIPSGQPTDLYQIQMDEMAKNAREVWNGTSSIKDLPGSVRIYVIVFHVVSRFKAKYTNEPSLAMFSDGLIKNALMRPIKNLNGLACKTCVTSGNGPGAAFHSHPHPPIGDRKLYALPSLLSHFQSVHIERTKSALLHQTGMETPRLDWKHDMVELPEPSLIAGLLHAPGMDDAKLQLIVSAFPTAFPSPLPRLGLGGNTGPIPIFKEEQNAVEELKTFPRDWEVEVHRSSPYRSISKATSSLQQPPRSLAGHVSEYSSGPYLPSMEPSSRNLRASDPPGEDEYDPHRPAYLEPLTDHYARPQHRRKEVLKLPAKEDLDRIRQYPDSPRYRDDDRRSHSRVVSRVTRPSAATYLRSQDMYLNHSYHDFESPGPSPSRYGPIVPRMDTRSENRSTHPSDEALPGPSDEHREQRLRPGVVDQGSEDGEIGEDPPPTQIRTQIRTRTTSPAEEVSAAERFLNEFLPGQDAEEYRHKAGESNRRKDDVVKAQWPGVQDSEGLQRRVADEGNDTRSWKSDAAPGQTGENSLRVTPARSGPPPPRSGHDKNSHPKFTNQIPYQDHYGSRYGQSPAPRRGLVERSPELIDPRYVRNTVAYHDHRHAADNQGRRPRSRYDRYEAQRHEQYRTRSRSPQLREEPPLEVAYYRARSPTGPLRQEPMYRTCSPPLSRDQAPMKEQVTYTRVPGQGQFRYVEDDRTYRMPYGEAVEYVPIRLSARGPQDQEPYVLQQPIEEVAPAGYVRYERGYHGEQIYEHNGQLYRADPRPYDGHDARAPSLASRHLR